MRTWHCGRCSHHADREGLLFPQQPTLWTLRSSTTGQRIQDPGQHTACADARPHSNSRCCCDSPRKANRDSTGDPNGIGGVLCVVCLINACCRHVLGGMLGTAALSPPALILLFGASISATPSACCAWFRSSLPFVWECGRWRWKNRLTNVRLLYTTRNRYDTRGAHGCRPRGDFFRRLCICCSCHLADFRPSDVPQRKPRDPKLISIPRDRWAETLRLNSSYPEPITQQQIDYHVSHVWLGLILMYLACHQPFLGLAAATKGPGNGFALRLPIKVSSVTSTS